MRVPILLLAAVLAWPAFAGAEPTPASRPAAEPSKATPGLELAAALGIVALAVLGRRRSA